MPRLILASASPRRSSLLGEAGYRFLVHPANIDESANPANLNPPDLAQYLARAKAEAVSARFPQDVVLAADTLVALGDLVLGKPAGAADAQRMLRSLSGSTHIVVSGVSVIHADAGFSRSKQVISTVQMRRLTEEEIQRYLAGGEWQGKAGGYGIQDPDPFVMRVAGCATNIVGLPMTSVREMLAEAGIRVGGPDENREG